MTNVQFCLLMSRTVRTHFSSIMSLNNWKIIAEMRSHIFIWRSRFRRRRVCLSSLLFDRQREKNCVKSENSRAGPGRAERAKKNSCSLLIKYADLQHLCYCHRSQTCRWHLSISGTFNSKKPKFLTLRKNIIASRLAGKVCNKDKYFDCYSSKYFIFHPLPAPNKTLTISREFILK